MTEVYAVARELHEEGFAIEVLCESLSVSRSAYYAWQDGEKSSRQRQDEEWMPLIQAIFLEHKRRYGARRIAAELADRGVGCGVKRVGRLMRSLGLKAIQPRSFQPKTTNSRHTLGYNDNLLIAASAPVELDRVWVADITYIPLRESNFLYLAMLMDLCSRRILSWSLQDHMQESLVLCALRSAITARQPARGLVHHSDRGGQYCGSEYRQVLARAGMLQSMSETGDSHDNAFMESCFGTIKTELEMEFYENAAIGHKEIGGYIRYYNHRRRHSSLAYLTPCQYEAKIGRP